jgi:serine/threonine-protein kinase
VSAPDAERWKRLRPLLESLVELSPEEREARLARAAPDLAAEARELLAADEADASLRFDEAVAARAAAVLAAAGEPAEGGGHPSPSAGDGGQVGRLVGPWRLERLLGRGGMAEVWEASRADGQYERTVAVKLLQPGMDSAEFVARFLRERQILARLDHPAIARLFDGGLGPDGRPYIVLERVEGEPITDWCQSRRLGVRERLRLLVACAEAVAAAHRRLVVHRDLKPSNILVTADGRVKLLDFGIAKLLAPDDPLDEPTRAEVRVLTPSYAAPEQILGEPVTTATDVYALGVLAYVLLTGNLPHRRRGRVPAELAAGLAGESIARPSTAVLELSPGGGDGDDRDPRERRRLARALSGDLDVIVMKALRREPERRYPSVAALAEDLERFLAGRPISARADSLGYRAAKLVRRHRLAVAATALALLSLVGGLVAALWQADRAERAAAAARRAEEVARAEATRSEAVVTFLGDVFAAADPEGRNPADLTARELLERGVERVDTRLAEQPDTRAAMLQVLGSVQFRLGLYDAARERLEEALALRRALPEVAPRDLARTAAVLGSVYHRQGRSAEGVALLEEALALTAGAGAAARLETASHLSNLANAYRALDRQDEARAAFQRAIAILDDAPEADPGQLPRVLNNYGLLLDRARDPEARPVLERALRLHERNSGPDSALVGTTLGNLSNLYLRSGEIELGVDAARRSVAITEKAYGPLHYETALTTNGFGWALLRAGRPEEARETLERALVIFRAAVGEEHRATGYAYRNLGQALVETGRPAEAAAALRRADVIWRATLPPDAPELGTVYVVLAPLLPATGAGGERERLLLRAVELWETTDSHRNRLGEAWLELARARVAGCRLGEAREALAAARLEASAAPDAAWVATLPAAEAEAAEARCAPP